MFHRRKTAGDRFRDVLSALLLAAVAVAAVTAGMGILVVVAPVVIGGGSPSPSPTRHVFPVTPSYAVATEAPVVSPVPSVILPESRPGIVKKTISERDPDKIWELEITEPQFQTGSTPLADAMNQTIDDFWRGLADQFEGGPAAVRTVYGKTNHFVGTFTNELVTPELASFAFTWTNDAAADTTDSVGVATMNFDLATGALIEFDDLFADPDGALGILSKQSADLLYYQLGTGWIEANGLAGTTPNHANFSNWEVTKDGLRIIFNQYQVTTLPKLTPSVVVPWNALTAMMLPRGPVAVLAGLIPAPTPAPTLAPIPSATQSIEVKS